jgi:hypothetical protein
MIDIHTVAVEGTYDELRTKVVEQRAKILRSQLFGEILPTDQLASLSAQAQRAIGQIDIDFRPPPRRETAVGQLALDSPRRHQTDGDPTTGRRNPSQQSMSQRQRPT